MREYFVAKKHIELDLHGMTLDQARHYLEVSVEFNKDIVEEIIVIHGYKHGNCLKDYVQKEFSSKFVSRKYVWMNPGVTSLIISKN